MTFDELCELSAEVDQFMELQITDKRWWFILHDRYGEDTYVEDSEPIILRDWLPNFVSVDHEVGYGARMSAPGYLDCTKWAVFNTEQEAIEYLHDMYVADYLDEESAQ